MKISYNWLQTYFEEKLPEPEKISEGIIFHAFEVEEMDKIGEDTVFDIKVLPDRAHDCLSHFGIAKEISAIFNIKLKNKEKTEFENKDTNLDIQIDDPNCLRYMGRIIRNIKVKESPEWLKERLRSIGQKSINNIVDIANFIMFDIGQPIHCFDLDKLENEKIIIRKAKDGEKITTLDKKEINLDESMLIISDMNNPLAIAGIKGGVKAEVDNNTKNILIEVANFNSVSVRKTSKKINILTDAVKRYENELSPDICFDAMTQVAKMIYSEAGGEVEDIIDIYKNKPIKRNIIVSLDYINKRLGSNFSIEEIRDVWNRLNFVYKEEGDQFDVEIPHIRLDLNGPHDLTEEVIRILGYDRLLEQIPEIKNENFMNEQYFKMLSVRRDLLDRGYSELMTYVFRDKGDIEVLASASDKKFLRINLKDGLLESINLNVLNAPLLGMKEIRVFEIGTVFLKTGEEIHVAFGDKKKLEEMTLDEYLLRYNEVSLPFQKDSLSKILGDRPLCFDTSFKPWSLYPFIYRDVAVWLPEGEDPKVLVDIYIEFGGDLLVKEPMLIDKFTKEGKTSYAYRLVFQSYDRTLKDEEINNKMVDITNKIKSLNFEVR